MKLTLDVFYVPSNVVAHYSFLWVSKATPIFVQATDGHLLKALLILSLLFLSLRVNCYIHQWHPIDPAKHPWVLLATQVPQQTLQNVDGGINITVPQVAR